MAEILAALARTCFCATILPCHRACSSSIQGTGTAGWASTYRPNNSATREVLVILDTTAWAQLGAMADVVKNTKALKVVIDHHVSHDDLGAELFKDSDAEATGRLVIDAADQLGVPVGHEIAEPSFVALTTDTGWFRFSSTTAGTLRLAARLVEAGQFRTGSTRSFTRTQSCPAASHRPRAGAHADRTGRPVDLHVARPRGF